jgi:periplasmic divalent cation tolerance protein
MSLLLLQTTSAELKDAEYLAEIFLNEELSTCIHIEQITSLYKWQGEINKALEYKIIAKIDIKNYEKACEMIKQNSSYELPEIIGIKADKISKEYEEFLNLEEEKTLSWMRII